MVESNTIGAERGAPDDVKYFSACAREFGVARRNVAIMGV